MQKLILVLLALGLMFNIAHTDETKTDTVKIFDRTFLIKDNSGPHLPPIEIVEIGGDKVYAEGYSDIIKLYHGSRDNWWFSIRKREGRTEVLSDNYSHPMTLSETGVDSLYAWSQQLIFCRWNNVNQRTYKRIAEKIIDAIDMAGYTQKHITSTDTLFYYDGTVQTKCRSQKRGKVVFELNTNNEWGFKSAWTPTGTQIKINPQEVERTFRSESNRIAPFVEKIFDAVEVSLLRSQWKLRMSAKGNIFAIDNPLRKTSLACDKKTEDFYLLTDDDAVILSGNAKTNTVEYRGKKYLPLIHSGSFMTIGKFIKKPTPTETVNIFNLLDSVLASIK